LRHDYSLRSRGSACGQEGYVGITNKLQRRLIEHRNHQTKGAQILSALSLFHTETFPDYATARAREKFLKSGQGRVWLRRKYPQLGPPEACKASH